MDEEQMARSIAEGTRREKVRTQTRNFWIFIATTAMVFCFWELTHIEWSWLAGPLLLLWGYIVYRIIRRYGR